MKKKATLFWVLNKMRRRLPALVLLLAASAGNAVFGVIFALGTRGVIDSAISGNRDAFLVACLQQAGIIAGILICRTLTRHLTEQLKAVMDRDWKQEILHDLLHGDFSEVSSYHSGELINRLNNDVRIVDEGLINALPNVGSMIARLVTAIAVLTYLEPWFALLVCGAGLIVFVGTSIMRRRLKALHKKVSEQDGIVSAFLQETLENLLVVQSMDISAVMEGKADELLEMRYQMQRKRKNVSLLTNTGVSVMTYAGGFVALVWCASKLLTGQITYGTLTAVTNLVGQLQSPFVSLSAAIPQYIAMTASAERLTELENITPESDTVVEDTGALYAQMRSLRGEGVSFSYDRNHVLNDASFNIPVGSFTAITGPSGIGKSTLLKLLLGIFQLENGQMYVDCGDHKVPINRGSRRMFAYVPQGNLLLSGTLRDNLLIVRPEATEAELQQAIYISAMDEFMPQLPHGLDTVLGEGGAGLSEGQGQRLALARAILGGAPILLLDESTSALDGNTERVVLERIRSLKDRTCIAVTHRPATLELCDWQLQIDNGKILMKEL